MKKTISKLMATAGALSLLASAIPFVGVSADEAAPFEYEKVEQYITHHFDYIDSGASDRVIDWILLGKMPENISNAIKKKQEEIQRMHELDFATGMLVQQDD